MKKVHKVALRSVMRILSAAHKAARYQLWLSLSYVQPLWLYTGTCRMTTHMNNPLNQFIAPEEVDFSIISSLFSFLYLSGFITWEVERTEKSEKKHSLLLYCIISKF